MDAQVVISARYGYPNPSPIYGEVLELIKRAIADSGAYPAIQPLVELLPRASRMLIGADFVPDATDQFAMIVATMAASITDEQSWFDETTLEWRMVMLDIYIAQHLSTLDERQQELLTLLAPQIALRIDVNTITKIMALDPTRRQLVEEERIRLQAARAIAIIKEGFSVPS